MWRYEPETRTIRSVPSNHWVASLNSWDGAENHQANARIIAAAPDLLAALLEVVAEWDARHADEDHRSGYTLDTGGIAQARAAIAKATGA